MESPIISIIVPVYNGEDFIAKTIDSALSQTFRNFELIVVDDASTDGTKDIIESFADNRIVCVFNRENVGAAVTRNNGIAASRGRYIAFLDGDDLWHPDKLEKQISFFESTGAGAVYSHYNIIDEKGRCVGRSEPMPTEATYKGLLPHCFIRTSSFVYDTSKTNGKVYFPLIAKRQDFGLFLRCLKLIDSAKLIDEVICSYRIHPNGISSKKLRNITYQWKLYREVEGLPLSEALYYMCSWFLQSGRKVVRRKFLFIRSSVK
jgi:glycosyltransferase involved in cell wall biosynthesis